MASTHHTASRLGAGLIQCATAELPAAALPIRDGPSSCKTRSIESRSSPAECVVDARNEWFEPNDKIRRAVEPRGVISFDSLFACVRVSAGEIMGRLAAETRDGVEISAESEAAGQVLFERGENCSLDSDGRTVFALCPGRVILRNRTIDITPVLEFYDEVFHGTALRRYEHDMMLFGALSTGVEVSAGGRIDVHGLVEEATITAGEDLVVRTGIVGHERGKLQAGGSIATRYCNTAELDAGADVIIANEAINSHLRAGGYARLADARVIGGSVLATAGIEVLIVGSPNGVATCLSTGLDPVAYLRLCDLNRELHLRTVASDRMHDRLASIQSDPAKRSAAEDAAARQLMADLQHLNSDIQRLREQSRRLSCVARSHPPGPITVLELIYPGVTVTVGNLTASFDQPISGPIRIERQETGNRSTLVMTRLETLARIEALPSHELRGTETIWRSTDP